MRSDWKRRLTAVAFCIVGLVLIGISCYSTNSSDSIIKCAEEIAFSTENKDEQAWSLFHIANYYIDIGDVKQALKSIRMIDDTLVQAQIQYNIVAEQVDGHKYKEAVKIAESINNNFEKSKALRMIALGYVNNAQKEEALELLNLSLEIAGQVDDNRSRALLLAYIAGTYAELEEHKKASDLLSQALSITSTAADTSEQFRNITTLQIIASTYWKNKQDEIAGTLLDSVFRLSLEIEETYIRDMRLFYLAHNYSKMGKNEMVITISQVVENPKRRDKILTGHIAQMMGRGEYMEARKLAKKIKTKSSINRALLAMTKRYIEDDDLDEALRLIGRMDDGAIKAYALLFFGQKYIQQERRDEAMILFSEALEAAKTAEDDIDKIFALIRIAENYVQDDKYDMASEILMESLELAKATKVLYQQATILETICENLAKIEQFNEALRVVEMINMPRIKVAALVSIERQRRKSHHQLDNTAKKILENIHKNTPSRL